MKSKILFVALLLIGVFSSILAVHAPSPPAWVDAGPDRTVYVGQTVIFNVYVPEGWEPGWDYGAVEWDFGDGSPVVNYPSNTDPSVLVNTPHVYSTPGIYTVTLSVELDGVWFEWESDTCTVTVLPFVCVSVDIKPGSCPNSINLASRGVVPVAVLTTDDFDALTIAPDTVMFAGASPLRWAMEDVDWDGDMDMLFIFKIQELNLDEFSTEATLSGETLSGIPFMGTDSVKIVP